MLASAPFVKQDVVQTKNVHLIWVNQRSEAVNWFFSELEEIRAMDTSELASFELYCTRPDRNQIRLNHSTYHSVGSPAGSPSQVQGRPKWETVFHNLLQAKPNCGQIGLFFCGSVGMGNEVREGALQAEAQWKYAKRLRGSETSSFVWHKENF